MDVSNSRAAGLEILTNPTRDDSRTFLVDLDAVGLVGDAADWVMEIHRKDSDAAGVTVIEPTVAVSSFANSVTFSWTKAQWLAAGLPGRGAATWDGWYRIHRDGDVELEVIGPFGLSRTDTNDGSAAPYELSIENSTITLTAVATVDAATVSGPRRPLPLDGRMIPVGHSIVLGTGSSLSSTTSLNGDSRQAVGGWVRRLAGQHPDRYFVIRNAGIGGDPVGALCETTEAVEAGATSVTVTVRYGLAESTVAGGIYVGGYPDGESKFPTTVTDNGDGTWTISGFTALASAHAAGSEVGWGVHGRLQATVLDYAPGTVPILCFTNDAARVADGTFTAAELVAAGLQIDERCRAAGSEPLHLEELPRSTYGEAVYQIVEALRYQAREAGYHLVPLYDRFAGGDGDWADSSWTSDGIHPSDLGHELIAREVHRYLTAAPLRIAKTELGTYDGAASAQNLIAHSCFLTGSSAGGGVVATGATWAPFIFSGTCVPSLEAPAADDNIVGQWQKLTASSLSGNAAIDFPVATQVVGDLVYLAARVKTENLSGGARPIVQFLTGSFTIDLAYQLTDDMDLTIVATTSELSAVSTSKLRMQFVTGSGSLWVANPDMKNLTTLGRAA